MSKNPSVIDTENAGKVRVDWDSLKVYVRAGDYCVFVTRLGNYLVSRPRPYPKQHPKEWEWLHYVAASTKELVSILADLPGGSEVINAMECKEV